MWERSMENRGAGWEDPVEQNYRTKWLRFFSELYNYTELYRFTRCYWSKAMQVRRSVNCIVVILPFEEQYI